MLPPFYRYQAFIERMRVNGIPVPRYVKESDSCDQLLMQGSYFGSDIENDGYLEVMFSSWSEKVGMYFRQVGGNPYSNTQIDWFPDWLVEKLSSYKWVEQ